MKAKDQKFDLEDRLVTYASNGLCLCDLMPLSRSAQNLASQLSRSCTAAALIYGEAQGAESSADFIHKMKLVLKELRETRVNLRIIERKPFIGHGHIDSFLSETNQLIAIFIKSIETARRNQLDKNNSR